MSMVLILATAGCGIRLEEDAPHVPLVPTREPIPGEAELIDLLTGTRDLALRLRAGSTERSAELAEWHDRQAVVLDAALRRAGVPAGPIDPSPAPASASSVGSASASAAGSAATAGVIADEQGAIEDTLALLELAPADLLPTLASLRACRLLVCRIVDPEVSFPPRAVTTDVDPEAVVPFLAASRQAAYGMEVVAARASGKRREQAIGWLGELRALALAQEEAAAGDAPPAPSAYALPLTADDADSAHRLAQYLLGALPGAYGDALAGLVPEDGEPDRRTLAFGSDWLARAAVLSDDSGTPPGAFPGLR